LRKAVSPRGSAAAKFAASFPWTTVRTSAWLLRAFVLLLVAFEVYRAEFKRTSPRPAVRIVMCPAWRMSHPHHRTATGLGMASRAWAEGWGPVAGVISRHRALPSNTAQEGQSRWYGPG
jgi:hypothetical protein